MAGIFGEFFLVSVSHETKHEKSLKNSGKVQRKIRGKIRGKISKKIEELSFCNFFDLTFASLKRYRVATIVSLYRAMWSH